MRSGRTDLASIHSTDWLCHVPVTILGTSRRGVCTRVRQEYTAKARDVRAFSKHLSGLYCQCHGVGMGVGYPGWWLSPVTQGLGRLRQKAHHEFVASLGYLVKFRVAWTRVRACIKQNKTTTTVKKDTYTPGSNHSNRNKKCDGWRVTAKDWVYSFRQSGQDLFDTLII